jgi:hypothetical protein
MFSNATVAWNTDWPFGEVYEVAIGLDRLVALQVG